MDSLLIATGLTTFALGAAMILFAWTIVRQNRRREDARVELLSGLAFPDGVPVTAEVAPIDAFPLHVQLASDEFLSEATTAAPAETLFREPEKSGAGSRRMIALAAVCAITVMVVSVSAWLIGASSTATTANAAAAPVAPATPATAPAPVARAEAQVELLALDHATTPAGLVVTGRLRNPINGASLHDVVAVVDVLDRTGRVLTTARAPIGRGVLNAGESSDFSVAAAKTADIARYRVVFHARERESVPQIDLRHTTQGSRSE